MSENFRPGGMSYDSRPGGMNYATRCKGGGLRGQERGSHVAIFGEDPTIMPLHNIAIFIRTIDRKKQLRLSFNIINCFEDIEA